MKLIGHTEKEEPETIPTGAGPLANVPDMTLYTVSHGRPVWIEFEVFSIANATAGQLTICQLIEGATVILATPVEKRPGAGEPIACKRKCRLSGDRTPGAGPHTYTMQAGHTAFGAGDVTLFASRAQPMWIAAWEEDEDE